MGNFSREGTKDASTGLCRCQEPSAESLVVAYRQMQLAQGWAQYSGYIAGSVLLVFL